MPRIVQATDHIAGQAHGVSVEGKPDTCPRCHHGIDAKEMPNAALSAHPNELGAILEIVYRCPLQRCAKFFVAAYMKPFTSGRHTTDHFYLQCVLPKTPKEAAVSLEVAEVSPAFKAIYNQAAAAEGWGRTKFVARLY